MAIDKYLHTVCTLIKSYTRALCIHAWYCLCSASDMRATLTVYSTCGTLNLWLTCTVQVLLYTLMGCKFVNKLSCVVTITHNVHITTLT